MKKMTQCTTCPQHHSAADTGKGSYYWLKCLGTLSPFRLRLMLAEMLLRRIRTDNQTISSVTCPGKSHADSQKINIKFT